MKLFLRSFLVTGVISFVVGIGYGWTTLLPLYGGWNHKVLTVVPAPTQTQQAFGVLMAKTPEELEQVDTATLGWACLGGVVDPANDIDLAKAQARMSKLAEGAKDFTQANFDLNKGLLKTEDDKVQLRIGSLLMFLGQDYKQGHFAEQYDPDAWKLTDWGKSRPEDLLFDSSFNDHRNPVFDNPVWFVAVGQELKYPVKLVSIPGRLCAVWDDGKSKWYVMPSSNGLEIVAENHVKERFPISDAEIKKQNLYHEYSQAEVLAAFLKMRGEFLESEGLPEHAVLAYAAAHRFAPDTQSFTENLSRMVDSQIAALSINRKTVDMGDPERFMLRKPSVENLKP